MPLAFPATEFDSVIYMSRETRAGAPAGRVPLPLDLAIIGVYLRATGSEAAATVLVLLFHLVVLYIAHRLN
ncbi:hypothetical protein PG997_011964 [Apiospora hydei]|uniref:Uncharacterized protein n=1 Tax=Apiospora hydei TaxID=1337664 RepID=A0ABR1V225_9PEZI